MAGETSQAKAPKKRKNPYIMSADIYTSGCTIRIGPRHLDAASQATISYGRLQSPIIYFKGSINPNAARGTVASAGAGVKKDSLNKAISTPGG